MKWFEDFQTEANSGVEAEVKAFAAGTLPKLKLHLRLAKQVAVKVNGGISSGCVTGRWFSVNWDWGALCLGIDSR